MDSLNSHIATFYSYKGGTGRSMALANFAWILAANGKRVLAIDWDLEAPGLHRYFRPFLVDPDLFETDGLIDTFWHFAASALASTKTDNNSPEVVEGLDDAIRRLDWKFATDGYIDFIGAGRQGATYSERVNTFDWRRFYELGGARVLAAVKAHLRTRYEWILIDSRTGVSDTSGICTIQMPDTVVACFTLNRQSIEGVTAILQSIRDFRSPSVDGAMVHFFPVAMRIENNEKVQLQRARGYARSELAEFLPEAKRSTPREYWDQMELAYRPSYAFEEILAAFGDPSGATGAADTMLSQVESMAQCITGDDKLRIPEILETDRASVLRKYTFGSATMTISGEVPDILAAKGDVSSADKGARPADDVADVDFLRGVLAKEQQWRKSDFFWRLLLSSRELDLLTSEDRRAFGRNMTYYAANSERAQRLLRLLGIAFAIDLLFALGIPLWIYFARYGLSLPVESFKEFFLLILAPLLTVFALIQIVLSLAVAVVANIGGNKPYGMTFFNVLSRVMLGPWREIPDYDPDRPFPRV